MRATAIVQHIVGSCNVIKLKSNLKNVKSSLNSALTAHVALAGDNVTLKEKVSKLKDMTKGLEDWDFNVEESRRKVAEEVERLKVALVNDKIERVFKEEHLAKMLVENSNC